MTWLVSRDLWQERLAFRDLLRVDPAVRDEYAALKDGLAAEHRADVDAYTQGKREFVERVLATVESRQVSADFAVPVKAEPPSPPSLGLRLSLGLWRANCGRLVP
jgi:GrpB protein